MIGAKPLRIRVDKVNGFIRVYHETRCLLLLGPEKCDAIYSRIRDFTPQKSGITYVFSHNYARIKIDSPDFLSQEKTLALHVIIFMKSVFDKNQNHYYCSIFLEKDFNRLKVMAINNFFYKL